MELSRRGMLGGVGVALAVGGVGFAGAASVTDGEAIDGGTGPDEGAIGGDAIGGDEPGNDEDGQTGSVPVDPDAPFEARLLRDGDDDRRLFGTGDLDRVQGVITEDDEHLVYVSLGDAGIDALQTGLTDAGATDDPEGFTVSMTLDETEVRRVDLDEATVSALTDEEWGGVLTLPFGEESVAASVYDSLADA
ncbi:hypothetical protein [Halorubrum lacusprofundi]|jgi:hypothetical protein|uniref:Uncharacterized protein n=1 Tax=Halorubrum lacusprofundi (strain ATCC 49239 / DSM 5036 / JCM 8891 / ACAM 34) TaxID=416348 RepID=B9LT75_HALLT|nr:hypothetical protein [Halorubrum lacusprofundi]ACM58047.1 hypothetical protein Hlac_2474 [Halorubrum lacusprofundi ATCC 49239]MCG1006133.1 hypothetical protein [Halorubrum lacusprofundi]